MAKSKSKKSKIPKQIGGIKIPKELRDATERLAKWAESPLARQMMAAGLTAAAAALSETRTAQRAAKAAGDGATKAAASATKRASRVRTVVTAAASAMGRDLLKAATEGDGKAKGAKRKTR